jgi:hypothetical protein
MLNGSIENLAPKHEFLVRWACKLAGAKLKTWAAKPRKKEKEEANIIPARLQEK